MGKEVNDKISTIINSIKLLELNQLDGNIARFLSDNFNYFMKHPKDSIVKENEFVLVSTDDSIFKISLLPNYITPTSVYIELINMNSEFIQNYTIEYLNDERNSVKTTYRKYMNCLNNQNKTTVTTFYDNGKKTFIKKYETFMEDNNIKDRSCSRETKTFYYNLDNKYVESQISVGMPCSYFPTNIQYTKYDGDKIIKISQSEFSTLRYRKKTNKVLKHVA